MKIICTEKTTIHLQELMVSTELLHLIFLADSVSLDSCEVQIILEHKSLGDGKVNLDGLHNSLLSFICVSDHSIIAHSDVLMVQFKNSRYAVRMKGRFTHHRQTFWVQFQQVALPCANQNLLPANMEGSELTLNGVSLAGGSEGKRVKKNKSMPPPCAEKRLPQEVDL